MCTPSKPAPVDVVIVNDVRLRIAVGNTGQTLIRENANPDKHNLFLARIPCGVGVTIVRSVPLPLSVALVIAIGTDESRVVRSTFLSLSTPIALVDTETPTSF